MSADRWPRAWLSARVEPGLPAVAALIDDVGAAETVRALADGRPVPGVPPLHDAQPERTANDVLAAARRAGLRLVCPGDGDWPAGLGDLLAAGVQHGRGGPPCALWVRGDGDLAAIAAGSVAIVGCRASTAYGDDTAGDIAAGLGDAGITVLSGAAYGIDAAAHRGVLAVGGRTLAVLACGADVVYPRGHDGLLSRIGTQGMVVSEAPPGAHPTKIRFLARNRLIAALTQAVVVVEASWRSGALSTLKWAGALGRMCLAVPGPVTSASSAGVHLALREHRAELVTCAAEVREALAPLGAAPLDGVAGYGRGEARVTDGMDPELLEVLEALPAAGSAGATTQVLSSRTGLNGETVQRALVELTESALVECVQGGWRMRPRRAPLSLGGAGRTLR